MSEAAGKSKPGPSLGQKAWQVFLRILLEVLPPGLVAAFAAWLTLKGSSAWEWNEAVLLLGNMFVASGMLWGVILRSAKNVTDKTRYQSLIVKQKELVDGLERAAVDVAGYTTGGDSFARVLHVRVAPHGSGEIVAQLTYLVRGKYPLYDVTLHMSNMDDPAMQSAIRAGTYRPADQTVLVGNLVPKFAYEIQCFIPIVVGRQTQRINLNWKARNGSWHQRLELTFDGSRWLKATYVKRGPVLNEEEIYVAADDGYQKDDAGRPVFDASPPPSA